jgi:hypothetical protein
MIAASLSTTATRDTGIVVHAVTAVVCGFAWRAEYQRGRSVRLASTLTLLECFLGLDAVFNWRWRLHGLLMGVAMHENVYGERGLPQAIALLILAGAAGSAVYLLSRPGGGGRTSLVVALSGGIASTFFWCVEVVSLHISDRILESYAGPVMLIAVVWIVTSAMTAGGMLVKTAVRSPPRAHS